MRKLLLVACAISCSLTQAQFNPDAPWMKELNIQERNRANNPVTFQETVNAFNTYWETRDPDKKGSGYKPFKRWESFWKNHVKEDGTLPSTKELWNTHLEVQNLKSQKSNRNTSSFINDWQPVGPFAHTNTGSWTSGQGRVNVVIKDPNNPNTYYAGTPSGGIWKSTNGGSTWITTTDHLPQLGVSGIAIDPTNSDIVYIATGDDDGDDSSSIGVLKSKDGGMTWNTTGLNLDNTPSKMNDIYINENNSQIVTVATNEGVYKSTNGGTSWTVATGNSGENIRDLKIKPNNPSIAYSVSSIQFYKSTDGGNSFNEVSNGLPTSDVSRFVIDVTPANPEVVYVLAADQNNSFKGIYKSTDSGDSFIQVASLNTVGDIFSGSNQAWFDLALSVSDTDENRLYVGVLDVWKGTVNGTSSTFTKLNSHDAPNQSTYTHADIHYLRHFDGELLVGSDGGFYKSTNNGNSFTDLTAGMQIGQFYRIAVSKQTSNKIVGGLQDNGGYALNNNTWQNYYGADGMDTAIDPQNSNLYYGFTQNGKVLCFSNQSGSNLSSLFAGPEQGNWITPLTMNSNKELYAGYLKLYRFEGNAFTAISPGFEDLIDALEIDDINPDNIYIALNRSLRKSTNRGVSFSEIKQFTSNITSIEVNNDDSNVIYVTTSDNVYKSTDGGTSFTSISAGLPNGIGINIIKHQKSSAKSTLFLGANIGVYKYEDDVQIWELDANGLPNVPVTDLEINTNDNKITISTYGRGVWQSDLNNVAPNDVRLLSLTGLGNKIECGVTPITPQVTVRNSGLNTINDVEFIYTVNGTENVFNWTGTIVSDTNETISLPQISLATGIHSFKVVANIANDSNLANNNSTEELIVINSSGAINSVNTFESISDELLVFDEGPSSQQWQRGIPIGTVLNDSSNPSNNVYGTNLSGKYDLDIKSYLISRCYDLTTIGDPVLKFDLAFDLELRYDILYVEYSTDQGGSWSLLGTSNAPNWYNSNFDASICENCIGGEWNGTDSELKEYSYNLSAFNTESNFIYRFVFHSDHIINKEGAIIDNPVITSSTLSTDEFEASSFSVYPNPSKGVFNIKSKLNTFDYAVHDVTGKQITAQKQVILNDGAYKLDMSAYASGVYFLNITTSKSKITKKLIIK